MDPVGHYSRPDVTCLLFSTDPSPVGEHFHKPLHEGKEPERPKKREIEERKHEGIEKNE